MKIAIPVKERDPDSTITALDRRACFALMELDQNARIKTIDFVDKREEILEKAEMLVIQDPDEEVDDFLDMSIQVLMAEFGSTIEDIHEAYIFTQLREIS